MKIKKTISLIIILVFILTLLSGCSSASLIQLNIKKGDSYKVTQSTDQKISLDPNGLNRDTNQSISITYIYNIVDVDSVGTATIKVKYDSITQKQTGVGSFEYDSAKDSDKTDPRSLCFNSIIGQEFSFTLAKTGEVLSVSGINEMLDNVFSKVTGIDTLTKTTLITALKQYFGNDAVKESLSQMTDIYPGKEVKTGDSWKKYFTINFGIPIEISSTMKLKQIKDDVVTIDVKSIISTNDSAEVDISGLKMKYKISGKQDGTLKITKSNGFIQNGNLTQALKGTAEMEGLGQNFSMPVNIESKITYTSEKQN